MTLSKGRIYAFAIGFWRLILGAFNNCNVPVKLKGTHFEIFYFKWSKLTNVSLCKEIMPFQKRLWSEKWTMKIWQAWGVVKKCSVHIILCAIYV